MILAEALWYSDLINGIKFGKDDSKVSSTLAVKVMTKRIALNKIRKTFDEDNKEFVEGIRPDGYIDLYNKKDKTEDEEVELKKESTELEKAYGEYITKKNNEEVSESKPSLTESEFAEILKANIDTEIMLRDRKVEAPDFLEIIHDSFVSEETEEVK